MGLRNALAGAVSFWLGEGPPAPPPAGADFWYEPIGSGVTPSGIRVTPDIALKASALWTVVTLLAKTISTLPIHMYERIESGARIAPDHPLEDLVAYQPNVRQTAVEFWEELLLAHLIEGYGIAEILSGPRGDVDELEPIYPGRIEPERLPDRTLRFKVYDPHQKKTRILLQEDLLRIPGPTRDGGIKPLRAVDLAADAIGLGLEADNYAARVFSNKLNIGGFLVHPSKLSPEAQRNLVHALMQRFAGGGNTHRPMLLTEGMKFEKASMDASEAQLLEARKWQVAEIARRWHVPLHMVGIDDQRNRATVEEQSQNFIRYCLRPIVKRVELAVRRDLIIRPAQNKYFMKITLEGLARGDSKSRAEYFSAALGSGGHHPWMTQDEVRGVEGLNPLGGDAARLQAPMNRPVGATAAAVLEDNSLEARAGRLVRKECTAIRRASMRLADDEEAFGRWLAAFYGGHVSDVMEALDLPKDVARQYCEKARDQVLAADDVEALMVEREDAGPAEIAKAITEWKDAQQ